MALFGSFVLAFVITQIAGAPSDPKKPASSTTIRSAVSGWSGEPIVFPDASPISTNRIAPCPSGQKLCDEDENYPSDIIQRIPLETIKKFSHYFVNDSLLDTETPLAVKIDAVNEQDLCLSKEMLKFPKKAEATDNEMKYIVQIPGTKMQGVRVELCANEGSSCYYNDTFPLGYKTVCRQKYIHRTFLTLVQGTDKVETSEFSIPSCCVCKIIPPRLF
ncbi:Hypothetical protein NTJ_00651 [Nesidiocoris tenuis]|uniref:Spaetzle domain-containing protein n=1 Tax=Nesidiocoris tenuis TaxID=355587 RepID=A0ABN7A6W1_9HEMI|nr:Hypothetical protein NTJ_00651 [Nesidiocoris tenuis]